MPNQSHLSRHFPNTRLRRTRFNQHIREMVSETNLQAKHLIEPVFVLEGRQQTQSIESMPNVSRMSIDILLKHAEYLLQNGVSKLAIFPVVPTDKKSLDAKEAYSEHGSGTNRYSHPKKRTT